MVYHNILVADVKRPVAVGTAGVLGHALAMPRRLAADGHTRREWQAEVL